MLAGPQGMKVARRRSRMRRRDLWTCGLGRGRGVSGDACVSRCRDADGVRGEGTYFGGIGFALDDVEDADVAAFLAGGGGDHAIFGLQEAAHDVEDGGFADRFGLLDVVAGEGGVGGHEEVAAGGGDQGGEDADEVVVHVAGVAEGGGGGGHDGGDLAGLLGDEVMGVGSMTCELVCLLEGWFLHMQPIRGDSRQCAVI